MQRCRIEVGSIRPHERPRFVIELYCVERRQFLQWPEEWPPQDGFEVDALLGVVAEPHREGIRADDTELRHPMDWMAHALPEWFDLDGRLAGLQEIPVRLQFCSVDLGPSFNQPLLRLRKAAAQAVDRVHRKHRRLILIVRVEVRPVMLAARFDEHSNDNPEEP